MGIGAAPLQIDGGSAEMFGEPASYVGYQDFDGIDSTKCDFNAAGRYLSLRMKHADYRELTLAGLDFEFSRSGKRG
jgi:hypothetical protein